MKKVDIKGVAGKGKGFISEFKTFIARGNVMDLAVGVIIGAAFKDIVDALTSCFIKPLLGLIGGAEVHGTIALGDSGQYLDYGTFLTAVINFLIMAFILFLMLKIVNKMMSVGKKKNEEVEEVVEVVKDENTLLLEEIRDLLKEQKSSKK